MKTTTLIAAGIAAGIAVLLLGGCSSLPPTEAAPGGATSSVAGSPWAAAAGQQRRPDAWEHYALPGKRAVDFQYVRHGGREAVAARSASAASMMRKKVRVEPAELGSMRFSWQVPELIAQADLALRDKADSPVRIVLAFEGDRSRFSARDAALAELAHALTGEPMPYATLMYVWCNVRPPGSVIRSSRTDRVRKFVVESGSANLGRWLDYERDIRADFEQAFGEAPGALVGIAIMTDSDNTGTQTRAWYGPARLIPAANAAAGAR